MFQLNHARQIYYTGRVQGVGFRYATKQLAKGFDVTGWVKNLADGRVELFVQTADVDELNAFLEELEVNSAVAHHIKEKQTLSVPVRIDVTGFSITS
jgi:acylphosphatase